MMRVRHAFLLAAAPKAFKYTSTTPAEGAAFYDAVLANYLANDPNNPYGPSAMPSKYHYWDFLHFCGITDEEAARDEAEAKKRHAAQDAGKKKRETKVLARKERLRQQSSARVERLRGLVGKRVEVFWPKDDRYYPGVVTSYKRDGGTFHHTIRYDDDDEETINLAKQTWHEIDDDASDSEPDAPPAKKPKGLREERIEALKKKGPDPW